MIGPEFFDTWQCDASISEHRDGAKITFEMASNRALLARLVDRVNTLFADFDTAERVKLTIVVRELVDNAIVHGNHESLSSEVRCELLRTGPGEVRVRVRDEGAGFDYASLDMSLPEDPRQFRQRGYRLVNAMSEVIEFNQHGNEVTALVHIEDGEKEHQA